MPRNSHLTALRALVRRVLDQYRLHLHGVHGPSHWLRVRANGLALARATPDADAELVELFALLHDSQRFDEMRDQGHGTRAAAYVQQLHAEGVLTLEASRLRLLVEACEGHNAPQVSTDPTIGCCWDADRLDLSRLGRRPHGRYLSTAAARDPELQAEAWEFGQEMIVHAEGAFVWGIEQVLIPAEGFSE